MISFDRRGIRFKYRVAGLCVHDGYVLLTRPDQDEYWILPGGRVELGEDSRTALEREIVEETGRSTRVGNLLWVTENFFDLDGIDYHELACTYAIFPDAGLPETPAKKAPGETPRHLIIRQPREKADR